MPPPESLIAWCASIPTWRRSSPRWSLAKSSRLAYSDSDEVAVEEFVQAINSKLGEIAAHHGVQPGLAAGGGRSGMI
jgi:hypothetical protein